jgi:ribulose 1,5-bisphosphate synthetase/thiazole synthase
MTGHAVVIAGGGPTGLMLAGELALAGVDVAIVERRASQELDGSRAGGLHSRTIEVALWQSHFERILAAWVSELGVPIAREREVTGSPRKAPASTSSCLTAIRYGRTTSSGATGGAA